MPKVDYTREEIKTQLPAYKLIRDCVAGEQHVKKEGDKYLPRPNAEDKSESNQARYKAYVDRAVFYNVTKRTLNGLIGQIFLRRPVVEVPTLLEPVRDDATGGGVSIEQLSKRAANYVVGFGRAGLFVDYPAVDAPTSRADMEAGNIRPTIAVSAPWEVINWRTITRGGRELLSLVVMSEKFTLSDDGFELKQGEQFRVLRLVVAPTPSDTPSSVDAGSNDGDDDTDGLPVNSRLIYQVELWRKGTAGFNMVQGYPKFPRDASGANLEEIPFVFIGSDNNDTNVDNPPLYDLASLNIAHYRNSADYEESAFIVGQPTPYFSGLTEDWVNNVLKGTVTLGARGAVPLPEGGSAGLLQATPNTLPFEAMQHKERQMVALGAKLVEDKQVQRTATEADIEHTSESSTLASSAQNVGSAFKWALDWCAVFVGVPDSGIKFELNTEFDLTKMTPEERKQLVAEWQAGAIAFTEMRENLRRGGIAKLDDEKAKAEIEQELASAPKLDAQGNPVDPNADPNANPGAAA